MQPAVILSEIYESSIIIDDILVLARDKKKYIEYLFSTPD